MLYVYDDTFEGAMTSIFDIFELRDKDATILSVSQYENLSFYTPRFVAGNQEKSGRVLDGLFRLGEGVPTRMYECWLSHLGGVEDLMLTATRLGFKFDSNPFVLRHFDAICKLDGIARKVGWEAQRMLQFVRFVRLDEKAYIADIEPQFDVLPLIGNHFHQRFPDVRFIIRNVRHCRAIVSEPSGWHITDLPDVNSPLPTDGEYEELWKMYFKTIAIEQRVNLKLQQQFVPKKYRRFMTEFETV